MNTPIDRLSDERLFIRYIEGDGGAFTILMDRYAVRLLRYCRGFVVSEEEAEDLVQETFLRAIRSASTYRATSRFSTWIHTIARNQALDYIRMNRNRADLREGRYDRIAESTMSEPAAAPDRIDSEGLHRQLLDALAALTTLEAETIRLTFLAEWSTSRIAELQGCSRATVRTRRHQALEKIRPIMLREKSKGIIQRNGRLRDEEFKQT